MKSITKLITLSFALLLCLKFAVAQKGGDKTQSMKDPAEHAEKRTERLVKKLSLTEAQAAKVAEINLAYAQKMHAAKSAASNGREALRTEHKNAIKAQLTPEQITEFEAMKGGDKGKRGEGRRGGKKGHRRGHDKAQSSAERAAHRAERLTEKLSLTEEQSAKVEAINLDFAKKKDAAKAAAADREAGKAAIKELRTEQKAAITTILTPEQLTAYEAMKSEREGKRGRRGPRGEGKAQSSADRAAHHTERLTKKLSLTEAQSEKVAAINLDFAKKREAERTAMDAMRTEHKNAIKAVLTPEQITTFDSMKDERKGKRGGKHRKNREE